MAAGCCNNTGASDGNRMDGGIRMRVFFFIVGGLKLNREHRHRQPLRGELLATEISGDVAVAAATEVHFHSKC